MRIRFQADESLNNDVVKAIRRREPAIDFLTTAEAKLRGLDDPAVLRAAAGAGRMLVTADKSTLPVHFASLIAEVQSPGLVIVPRRLVISLVVEEIILIWTASEAEEWINRVCYIPL